ncbi:MAG: hypothetical protein JXB32_03950 [Deltaproteobacteria bacterium]|nr:hypothetical protein [Deltaproteobacteria bacterium]
MKRRRPGRTWGGPARLALACLGPLFALATTPTGCGDDDPAFDAADTFRPDGPEADVPGESAGDVDADFAADAPAEDAVDDAVEPQDDGATTPWVRFEEPADGATVPNPVRFRIAAGGGVDEVEIFADETYSLGAAWDPAERDTLLYRFHGTGTPRALHVVGRVGGSDAARDDLTLTVAPDSCEVRFFVSEFDEHNTDPTGTVDLAALRETALAAVLAAVEELRACGAEVTPGPMISLLLWESGLRVGHYNTRCEENSYNRTETDCDVVAEALYSYQLGIGGFHTSNLHPCKDRTYTSRMRTRFLELAAAAGYPVDAGLVTPALAARFHEVCPSDEPTAIDYYILGAHDVFGIPRDGQGNHLAAYGATPFFEPAVSIGITFREISASCASIDSDREAIEAFGGADASYGTPAVQDAILRAWVEFSAASCS